jgi:hypothetical protein
MSVEFVMFFLLPWLAAVLIGVFIFVTARK